MASPNKLPKVSVCVITYNQERYIRQCLQSIVDQVSDFDFEVIVGEDCSTDGTNAIVQEFAERYPRLIRPIFQRKNTGGCINYLSVHRAAKGEYVAHIDGDDTMLPNKLQYQVDFMDVNIHCPASFHLMELIDEKSIRLDRFWLRNKYETQLSIEDIIMEHPNLGHSSMMYRRAWIKDYLNNLNSNFIDLHIYIALASLGSLMPINRVLGLYRVGVGVSSQQLVLDLVFDAMSKISRTTINIKIINAAGRRFANSFARLMLMNKNHDLFLRYWRLKVFYNDKYSLIDSIIESTASTKILFVGIANSYIYFGLAKKSINSMIRWKKW